MRSTDTHPIVPTAGKVFTLTVSLFALWGLGHWLYQTLLPTFVSAFGLSGLPLTLTQRANSVVYFLGALPAAYLARRLSSKAAILIGLAALAIGAFTFYPAAVSSSYAYFLFAVTLMSIGWIMLEVTANPMAAHLGPPKHFIWRLNLAQSFYPVGALVGMAIGHWLVSHQRVMPGSNDALAIAHPYILMGGAIIVLAFLFEEVRFPALPGERIKPASSGGLIGLLQQPLFLLAMIAQAASIIVMVGAWSTDALSFANALPGRPSGFLGHVLTWVVIAFAIGRFTGTVLMRWIDPALLLGIFAMSGIAATSTAMMAGGTISAYAILAASFCASIAWPTVLGLAIEHTGALIKPATALVAMGGAAGGVAQQIVMTTWPAPTPQLGLMLPSLGFAVIAGYALLTWSKRHFADASV